MYLSEAGDSSPITHAALTPAATLPGIVHEVRFSQPAQNNVAKTDNPNSEQTPQQRHERTPNERSGGGANQSVLSAAAASSPSAADQADLAKAVEVLRYRSTLSDQRL